MIEVVKNIAAVVGCVLSCVSLATLCVKPIRQKFTAFVKRTSNQDEVETQLAEIKQILVDHIASDTDYHTRVEASLAVSETFTETQCRNILKQIFYRHRVDKVLPLYEKKTLMDIEELYIVKMKKNHWGKTLIEEMNTWAVDSSDTDMQDFDA